MKQFKACGARNLPSIDYGRNAAWLQLAALATHARRRILKIPPGWTWAQNLATAWHRLHALHPA